MADNLTPLQRASLLGPNEQDEAGRIFEQERNKRSRSRGNRQPAPVPQENLPTVRRENLPAIRNENLPANRGENVPAVRRETLPAIQGGGAGGGGGNGGSRAVVPSGGDRPPVSGSGSSRTLANVDNRIPLNLGNAASTAATGLRRLAARGLGGVGMALDSTPVANATLTGTPEGRRLLAEHVAQRASDAAAGAAENYGGPASAAEVRREAQNRAPRPNTRSNNRLSPRELTPDELHNIESLTRDPESGIAEMRGVRGEAARNIIARRAELEREPSEGMKRGGPVKKMAKGGVVKSSASGRSDGCAVKGKTKGRMV